LGKTRLAAPSVNTPLRQQLRLLFIGVFRAPNQRHAHPYYSKQLMIHFTKLDAAGSKPVSRSIFSVSTGMLKSKRSTRPQSPFSQRHEAASGGLKTQRS
jgi:hypothetical protein